MTTLQQLVFSLQNIRLISGDSKSLSDGTIILEENDKLQLQAATADIFEGTVAILEFDRT
jgi:hypothetical protein